MKKYLLALLAALLLSSPAWAAPLPGGDSDLPVDVTADNMEYSSDKKTVVFRGSVEAVRGEFKMWSDKLTLILKGKNSGEEKNADAKKSSSKAADAAGDLDRVIAEHNVRFKNGTQNGSAEKATFFAQKNILVLEGDPVLNDGENSIRGSVIRYFMNENRSMVEGSSKKRVHAVFSSEKKENSMGSILSAQHLRKRYGQKEVVHEVSVSMQQGEIVGLLGPNGAGKTTSFYMITGIIKPTSGEVTLDGQDISTWPLYRRARVGLSYLPQESSIFRRLTVRQNLQMILEHTDLTKAQQKAKADQLMEEFGLTRLEKSYASYLSGGERRRLEIARCLIREPRFVLLDEPFAGIDPIAVGDIQELIRGLKDRGIGVLISDHNVRETLSICDRAYLMFQGNIILSGTTEEIISNERAREVYLGESFRI
ncbi:MAG: LPS export ABC transporter ATP-binding protein [Mailhella sp.]|nr:LPS export ABC transporter ATP-binding protein [Mailhella sp.]